MSVLLQYIGSSGNVYNLKTDGIRTKTANYHKWKWGANGTALQYGIRISDFSRKPAEYETTLIFTGSYNARKELIDALHEDFELDVRTMRPGRIIWGDYYIDCYVTNSSTEPNAIEVWTNNTITFYCPYPFWIKEETKQFTSQEVPAGQAFLDYPFGYEYDYYFGSPGVAVWDTKFPFPSEFLLTLYGPVVNPVVQINGYPYLVNDSAGESEYITIDSRNNEVKKHLANGTEVNIFDLRNKGQSVFEPIPGGSLSLMWAGTFTFDLTLFEERSEPR